MCGKVFVAVIRAAAPAVDDLRRGVRAEEALVPLDPGAATELGQVLGRVDAQSPGAAIAEGAQQRGVVAADVDDETAAREAVARGQRGRQVVEVGAEGVGGGRHVQVVREHRLGRHAFDELDVAATVAEADAQGKTGFGTAKIFGAGELVGKRCRAEVKEVFDGGFGADEAAA